MKEAGGNSLCVWKGINLEGQFFSGQAEYVGRLGSWLGCQLIAGETVKEISDNRNKNEIDYFCQLFAGATFRQQNSLDCTFYKLFFKQS